jgi:endonuclease YncB( thermonuclease family)
MSKGSHAGRGLSARCFLPFATAAMVIVATVPAGSQQSLQPQWREIPATVALLTGDSWREEASIIRLYGVQACLRGTSVQADSIKRDCGDVSMVYLASLLRETKPACLPVAHVSATPPPAGHASSPAQSMVICRARIGSTTVDLGLALIGAGFAFAAFKPDGAPVSIEYVVAEEMAKKDRAGLWRYPDLPHPIPVLFGTLRANPPVTGAATEAGRRPAPRP